MKVKINDVSLEGLNKVKEMNIRKCKAFFEYRPFSTKLYMALQTKIPLSFIVDNWKEITGDN